MSKSRVKAYILIIVILTFIFTSFNYTKVVAGVSNTPNIKGVLVMDGSGSMKLTDPQNIRIDAFKLFIDMCRRTGDKIGLVSYGHAILKDTGIKDLNSPADKESLKNEASGIPFSNYTDIGMGLKQAVDNLSNSQGGEMPLILLLSDGKNDPDPQRGAQQSQGDLKYAVDTAKEKGFPIYTIGLNADGSVDKKLLEDIAKDTGGKSVIIDSPKDLPKIFGQVFADRTQAKIPEGVSVNLDTSYSEVPITIPDNNVVEANITVISDGGVGDVKLFDRDNREIKLPGENITLTKAGKYSLIKLVNPGQQNYKVKLMGEKGKTAEVSVIYNYDLQLGVTYTPEKDLKKGEGLKVLAELKSNGTALKKDDGFYKEFKGKLFVKEASTGEKWEIELLNTGKGFECEFKIPKDGTYEANVRLDGKNLYRESNIFNFTTVKMSEPETPVVAEPEPSGKESFEPGITLIAAAAGILVLIIILIIIKRSQNSRKKTEVSRALREKIKETAPIGEFSGQFMISIKSLKSTDEEFQPFFRKLDTTKKQVTLYELLSELPEYKEIEHLIFYPGTEKGVILKNNSKCMVEKNTVKIDHGREVKLQNEEKIVITLTKTAKQIDMQYFSRE